MSSKPGKGLKDILSFPMMADTTAGTRENYTKVVMQKTLCVPLLASWEDR